MRSGRQMPRAMLVGLPAITLCVSLLASGCASGHPAARAASATRHAAVRPARVTRDTDLWALAAAYLAIAKPANHRLDVEVDGFADRDHHNLAAAESDLRAEAVTEGDFDRLLGKIPFPLPIAAIAQAMIQANQSRVALTERQARSSSIAELLSFTARHKAADAAVEAQVRIIRQDLRLPPPETS
jgi:hypothetical protein